MAFYLQQIPDQIDQATSKWGEIRPNNKFEYVLDLWQQNTIYKNVALQYVTKEGPLDLKLQYSVCPFVEVIKDKYPDGIWFNITNSESTDEVLEPSNEYKIISMSTTPKLQILKVPPCRYIRFFIENPSDKYVHFLIHVTSI